MGPLIKYTPNLILRVEDETKANLVLDLYLRNKLAFERFEPTRPNSFYTTDYHAAMLKREYKAYQLGSFLRYYIYTSDNLSRIIGAVNFNFVMPGDLPNPLEPTTPYAKFPFAEIGYKIDSLYQNKGYGYEACLAGIQVMQTDYGFRQIDARIHPENIASIRLAEKLGFQPICLEPNSANIMGKYTDLVRYSLDISASQ